MSVNAINLSPSRMPTPLQDEIELRILENCEYVITVADSPSKKFEGRGRVFLTDLRVRYATIPPRRLPTLSERSHRPRHLFSMAPLSPLT